MGLQKLDKGMWAEFIWLMASPLSGSCKHCNKSLHSTRRHFLNLLTGYQLFKASAPWS